MIEFLFFILGFSAIATGAYYLLKQKEEPKKGYLWMGDGENPFKE